MDPTDRAIKGFYCIDIWIVISYHSLSTVYSECLYGVFVINLVPVSVILKHIQLQSWDAEFILGNIKIYMRLSFLDTEMAAGTVKSLI